MDGWSLNLGAKNGLKVRFEFTWSVCSSRPFLDFDMFWAHFLHLFIECSETYVSKQHLDVERRLIWTLVKKINKLNWFEFRWVQLSLSWTDWPSWYVMMRCDGVIDHDVVWSIMCHDVCDASWCVIITVSLHGLIVLLKVLRVLSNHRMAARGIQRCICQSDPKVLS